MRPWLVLALCMACRSGAPPEPAAEVPAQAVEESVRTWQDLPHRTVNVEGTELYVVDTGGDGPPVVLIHGMGSTLGFWQHQLVGPLADDARLIALDLPGWGRSDKPDGPYTPAWYAAHVLGVLDALDLDKAVVVGHSMGGQAAIALALDHPECLDALILSAPAGLERFTPEEGALLKSLVTVEAMRTRTDESLEAGFRAVFATWDADTERLLDERKAITDPATLDGIARATARSVAGMIDGAVADRLGDVSVPTTIVFGSNDLLIPNRPLHPDLTTLAVGQSGVAALPAARLVMLEGAGHIPHHDDPAGFRDVVRDVLSQVAQPEP